MRRVVITGMGTINPLGNSVSQTWEKVKNNECGIGNISRFDTTDFPVKVAGEVKGFNAEEVFGKKEAKHMDPFVQYAMKAAAEAFDDSNLVMENEDAARCGVIISSGIGGLTTIESEHSKGLEKGFKFISPHFIPMVITNMASGQIAIKYGFKGMCSCVVTACAGSNNAIGESFRHIRDGYADVMMCGGAESCITPLGMGGFASMRSLSRSEDANRASIPFDKERDGFVMGEGAGVIVLETCEHAVDRGAHIYGEIAGYGANCDAYHVTAPDPSGQGGADCMKLALSDAGMRPEDIDYINAHGTSTHLNDSGETKAIRLAFGTHADKLMVSSTKSMTGHMLGAAGSVEAIITTLAIDNGFVPATINYKVPDEECDLDIVPNKGREAVIDAALSNALGFGGHNASIIIRKFSE